MWELLGRLEYSWERKSIIKKYFRKNIFYTSHHLPPAGVEQHAVSVILVDRLDLLVAALVEGLGRGADVLLSILLRLGLVITSSILGGLGWTRR